MRDDWHYIVIVQIAIVIMILFCLFLSLSYGEDRIDGKVYIGWFDTENWRAQPEGVTPMSLLFGIELGYTFKNMRMYTIVDIPIDDYISEQRAFHPASVKFTVGFDFNFYKSLHMIGEHLCWHPIDNGGEIEMYNMLKLEYRF